MGNTDNPKRVSLRLPEEIFKKFKKFCLEQGLPKSKVLNQWIREEINLKLEPNKTNITINENKVAFNFFISDENEKKIRLRLIEFNLTITGYILIVIKNNLSIHSDFIVQRNLPSLKPETNTLRHFHENSNLDGIYNVRGERFIELEMRDKIIVLRTLVELGDFTKAEHFISILESIKHRTELEYIDKQSHIYFFKALIAKFQYKLRVAEKLMRSAIQLAEITNNRYLIGLTHIYLAKIVSQITDDPVVTRHIATRALEYFDVINHPLDVAQTLIQIGHCFAYNLLFTEAEGYYYRAREILSKYPNSHYWIFLHRSQSYFDYYSGKNITSVNNSLNQGATIIKDKKVVVEENDYLESIAKTFVFTDHYDEAHKFIANKKNSTENNSEGFQQTMANAFIQFIESKHDYQAVVEKFNKLQLYEMEYPPSQQCVQGAMMYLHGDTESEKRKGEILLKKLLDDHKNDIVGRVSQVTLTTKTFKGVF